ncbi:MAG: DinB family protein [Caldilineaceae bacterium]|nr:DinB family protein [Caldilineaceae bacterium]
MNTLWKTIIWQQFGAAIDDLDNSLRACADELWHGRMWQGPAEDRFFLPEFWYVVYHTLFWLDLYLTGAEEGFLPPPPFLLVEQDENGPLPDKPYTKEQLQSYLHLCRQRCQATIEALTDETAQRICQFSWGTVTFAELLLYNMRHVAGHAAQLNMLLGQQVGSAPDWLPRVKQEAD